MAQKQKALSEEQPQGVLVISLLVICIIRVCEFEKSLGKRWAVSLPTSQHSKIAVLQDPIQPTLAMDSRNTTAKVICFKRILQQLLKPVHQLKWFDSV